MATSSLNQVFSIGTTTIFVPTGTTNALFVTPQNGQVGWWLKWISGGTCEILGCGYTSPVLNLNVPVAATAAALNTAAGFGFQLDTTGSTGPSGMEINGPASFMLGTKGATASVQVMLLKGEGY